MFTGIIQALGQVVCREPRSGDVRLTVGCTALDLTAAHPGDSIAVNGVCLTAIALTAHGFTADVSRETLALSTLGNLTSGARVNVELALTLATPLGGHLVSGHVDGIGQIIERRDDARSLRLRIAVSPDLTRYIARKGSICVDGVSLTVNDVADAAFALNVVPHTRSHTIIDDYRVGTQVNVEVDLIARYLERLLHGHGAGCRVTEAASAITPEFLAQHGFGR
ncbi:riboflavin synthase [Rhodopseudomonas palustris]|uniref:Riboflavin synthase n=1 Tax=Thiospirillum jenense TaxID=1653858 RepID=A0A839HDX7_9GAMM|nr:riboflavin synthase [Thiospirillum jenense]MBB1093062.1 riboflavin synthase [Rhodopseudomonas palustris]MBB1127135.1 riboflavin synthase [Thiospirillum jenense]